MRAIFGPNNFLHQNSDFVVLLFSILCVNNVNYIKK